MPFDLTRQPPPSVFQPYNAQAAAAEYERVLPEFPVGDLGYWKVESLLGGGGFSHVVLARDPVTNDAWALKLIPAAEAASLSDIERCCPLLLAEARVHLMLSREPSILPCVEAFKAVYTSTGVGGGVGKSTHMAVLRMPVAACSVEEWLFSSSPPAPAQCTVPSCGVGHGVPGQIDEAEVLAVWLQMANAVNRCHMHGIVHKDVKLPNFMMDQRGKVMLMDFGLAQVEGVTPRFVAGTPWTMSPAGLRQGDDGRAGDWWSLGVVLYQLLQGGAWPFKQCWWPWQKRGGAAMEGAIRAAVLAGKISYRTDPAAIRISEPTKALIRGLLQPDPNRRWQFRQVLASDAITPDLIAAVGRRHPELQSDMEALLAMQRRARGVQAIGGGSDGGAPPAAGVGVGSILARAAGSAMAAGSAVAAGSAAALHSLHWPGGGGGGGGRGPQQLLGGGGGGGDSGASQPLLAQSDDPTVTAANGAAGHSPFSTAKAAGDAPSVSIASQQQQQQQQQQPWAVVGTGSVVGAGRRDTGGGGGAISTSVAIDDLLGLGLDEPTTPQTPPSGPAAAGAAFSPGSGSGTGPGTGTGPGIGIQSRALPSPAASAASGRSGLRHSATTGSMDPSAGGAGLDPNGIRIEGAAGGAAGMDTWTGTVGANTTTSGAAGFVSSAQGDGSYVHGRSGGLGSGVVGGSGAGGPDSPSPLIGRSRTSLALSASASLAAHFHHPHLLQAATQAAAGAAAAPRRGSRVGLHDLFEGAGPEGGVPLARGSHPHPYANQRPSSQTHAPAEPRALSGGALAGALGQGQQGSATAGQQQGGGPLRGGRDAPRPSAPHAASARFRAALRRLSFGPLQEPLAVGGAAVGGGCGDEEDEESGLDPALLSPQSGWVPPPPEAFAHDLPARRGSDPGDAVKRVSSVIATAASGAAAAIGRLAPGHGPHGARGPSGPGLLRRARRLFTDCLPGGKPGVKYEVYDDGTQYGHLAGNAI
ncbi:hypothetical protein HYH03_005815 [Edaphochlamys debaryana]|uniref:Protein kinase domain-containing protein n=1 Tax=Edaphochlamys debaryana TaxID=47281 RepID=A0A835Y4D7_9CHLO|nr:hypothetical protein HYH03_005815 [Edaphochlamys debaryana]|eukprot:KAG2496217.1 hypothetical protein HYH03_005815 [Edaphochlamys debaryana]